MSTAGISSSSFFTAFHPVAAQSRGQQFRRDLMQIGQDLQSGNLSQAQSDFSVLQQLLPGQSSSAASLTSASSATPASSTVSQAVTRLGQDLHSGNLSAAQSDFANLQQDLQQQGGVSTHRFHHHHHGGPVMEDQSGQQAGGPATLFGDLGQQLQSGNLAAAKQTYSTLQQDFLQFIGSGTANAPVSGSAVSGNLSISA